MPESPAKVSDEPQPKDNDAPLTPDNTKVNGSVDNAGGWRWDEQTQYAKGVGMGTVMGMAMG